MIPLTGYADRLSARPGETLSFKVSSQLDRPYEAHLVRIVCADPNPAGPGRIEEDLSAVFQQSCPSRNQPFHPGSYARTDGDAGGALAGLTAITLTATIWPTLPGQGKQVILAQRDPNTGGGFALAIGADGCLTARFGTAGAAAEIALTKTLRPRRWVRVWTSFDGATGRLAVGQLPIDDPLAADQAETAEHRAAAPPRLAESGPVTIAAKDGDPVAGHFNGKIEAPTIHDRALSPEELASSRPGEIAAGLVAHWDFSRDISSTRIEDRGPHALHGHLVNLPARAMTGASWTGRETCWRHAPEDYGAIHFHDDDIYDFAWETDFTVKLPADLKSAIYGIRLTCGDHQDTMPFFVCPPKGERQARLCVLASTFTYVVYGNHARPAFGPHWRRCTEAWGGYPYNPAEHREYGCSTYNFHSDGSGICHASDQRPLMTLRPGYITFGDDSAVSGLRHFQADSHLIAWLEKLGIDYDIVTDRELHEEGAGVLAGYHAVTTGSHPEYHTAETLDALQGYRDQGGNLLYLGGNGFYWRVALHQEEPGAIEIRRGEGGIRAWAAEPGEYFNAFDGNYGGLWRRNGRPPQKLAGIGFSAQGLFEGSYYRRRPEAADPRVAWILEGIEDEILGDFGFCGGGAAGFELDRADTRLGTPENAIVIASSEGHQDHFVLVPEEQLTHTATWSGEPEADLIRADITYFETPSGGAVFATGAITFCGSLPWNDFDNNISKMLENVLRRFLA